MSGFLVTVSSCYKELRLTTKPLYTSWPSVISFRSFGMLRKQNFKIVCGFKIDTAVFYFLLSLLPSCFFCWEFNQLGFNLRGKILGKLLESQDLMKGKVSEQWNKIFMEIFRPVLHGFLPFFPVSLTDMCSFRYGLKYLFTLHKLADKVSGFGYGYM